MKAKISKRDQPVDKFPNRTPLEKCREILEADKLGYTDEEVIAIRDFVHCMAQIIYDYYMRCKNGLHKNDIFDAINSGLEPGPQKEV